MEIEFVNINIPEKPRIKWLRGESLNQWFKYLKYFRPDISKLIIYDVKSVDRYFCTHSECQEVGSGCKSKYIPNNHALFIYYDQIIDKSKIPEKEKINNISQEEWNKKYEEIIKN